MTTRVLSPTPEALELAAELLEAGRLVAFPTETVYGLGALASDSQAIRSLFAAKGRPPDHPVIVHLASTSQLADWAAEIPREADALARAFWPGPLTLVLRRTSRASDLITGGLDTIGLRIPAHPVAQQLLRLVSGPLAAPSANRFGRVSPTTAEHVLSELEGLVDLILDGGACSVGVESTIVDLSRGRPVVLRPGGITVESLEQVIGPLAPGQSSSAPRVSGSLASHYAPLARVELVAQALMAERAGELLRPGQKVAALSRSESIGALPAGVIAIAVPEDDALLAQQLYAALRRADELGCDVVLATLPPEQGIGAAIADRLRKAAGPRERS
jgi:L-threonylcarbamoyladenylate synthase